MRPNAGAEKHSVGSDPNAAEETTPETPPKSGVRRRGVTLEEALERILWAVAALPSEPEWDDETWPPQVQDPKQK